MPNNPRSPADRRVFLVTAVLLGVISLLGISDLILDDPVSVRTPHVLIETTLLGASLTLMAFLLRRWHRAGRDLIDSRREAAEAHVEANQWRTRTRELLEGLGRQIDDQLRLWDLTRAEREVALFMLKGFSHREIADQLSKSERTVRQQAAMVYEKSGLDGRAQLSAFFLEDLLLPPDGNQLK